MKKSAARFFNSLDDANFMCHYSKVEGAYFADFWLLFEHCKVYNKISLDTFSSAISSAHIPLRYVLHNKNTVQKYGQTIADAMMSNADNATILLSPHIENLRKDEPQLYFPSELTLQLKEELICAYINSDTANMNFLKIVAQFKPTSNELVLEDKTRLAAKRKYEAQNRAFFENGEGATYKHGVKVIFSENQCEDYILEHNENNEMVWSYNIEWFRENLDFPTLMNNFIYLFGYTDLAFRSNFPNKSNAPTGFYEIIQMRGKDYYNVESMGYRVHKMMHDTQMSIYYQWLLQQNIRLEEIFKWFFEKYLLDEFGASGFVASMPSENTTYLEKCKLLASTMDGVLKQFSLFVKDGCIDRELLEISSKPCIFSDIPSF